MTSFPPLVRNFLAKNGGGLELPLLIIWVSADVLSLVGAVYTDLEFIQLVLCSYYVFADYLLVFQWFLYEKPSELNRLLLFTLALALAIYAIPLRDPLLRSLFGNFCGWVAAVLYIVSRLPQIIANYTKKLCEVGHVDVARRARARAHRRPTDRLCFARSKCRS